MAESKREGLSETWSRWAPALIVAIVGLFFASAAAAESGNVRYSYEKVEIADEVQYVLVPHPASTLKGDVSRVAVQGAFNLLKQDKSTSYGDSSISIDGNVPGDATVTVKIDPDVEQYKLIIMSETVYTLTEMGIDDIRFPGYAEGNVERQDIPFSAYNLTVPLWRAVPDKGLVDARARMPDGRLLPVEDVASRWERGDRELQEAYYSYLKSDQIFTVAQVLKRIPDLNLDYAPKVIPLLEHDASLIRRRALSALTDFRDDRDVLEAVVSMMKNDEKEELARKAAEFLGKSEQDRYRVQQQFFLLNRGSEDEMVAAAKALADFGGDDRVIDQLTDVLGSKAKKVATAAVNSLITLEAYGELASALKRTDAVSGDIRMQIAESLAEQSPASAKIDGYTYMARNKEGRPGRLAVKSLGDIGTTASRRAVEAFLTVDDPQLRQAAIETVESIGSIQSLPAIADAVRGLEDDDNLEEAAFNILVNRDIQTIVEKIRSSDGVIRRTAFRAMGAKAAQGKASQPVIDALKQGAESSRPGIRGAAARGFGNIGGEQALNLLKKLSSDSSSSVRRDVAIALRKFDAGKMTDTLVGYLEDSEPKVTAAAITTLAQRNETVAFQQIRRLAESDDPVIREAALPAMAKLVPKNDDDAVGKIISMLSGTVTSESNNDVLRATVLALGQFEDERAVNSIAIQLNARELRLRLASLKALGMTGHKSAVDIIVDTLADPNTEVRRQAVLSLQELGAKQAIPQLQARLPEEENKEVKELIRETINML
jgi:HEAT repeat protein